MTTLAVKRWIGMVLPALLSLASLSKLSGATSNATVRSNLVEAVLTEDASRQFELIKGFALSGDPFVEQALVAWRGGSIYLFEAGDTKIPFILDSQTDGDGKAKGLRLLDGSTLLDESGKTLLFVAGGITFSGTKSKIPQANKN